MNKPGNTAAVALLLAAGALLSPALPADDHAGWQPLFDGETLAGWRGYDSTDIPPGWRVEEGTIHFSDGKGDLVTTAQFTDFELALEWKVAEGGNSGIFYLAPLGFDAIYMGAPEMQVLDDARHRDGGDPLTSAGAAYGLYPAPRGVVNPAGDWNFARIRVLGNDVEHWLNGERVVAYTLGSEEWRRLVRESKFSAWPMYGMARRGHIGLQDHGDPVWYRNLRIRSLE
ncbi:MAG: DUF1080 domain-containing protein [Xanthomonadales bacterium]|nr:DUF1080 domain-containing protein [Xanthomonadales bacterium]